MDGVALALFVVAHPIAVALIAAVSAIERRRHALPLAANFRDALNLIAMAGLGGALVTAGFRPPAAAFLVGFYHWLILYGVSRLSLRVAWAASIVMPVPTLIFMRPLETAVAALLDASSRDFY